MFGGIDDRPHRRLDDGWSDYRRFHHHLGIIGSQPVTGFLAGGGLFLWLQGRVGAYSAPGRGGPCGEPGRRYAPAGPTVMAILLFTAILVLPALITAVLILPALLVLPPLIIHLDSNAVRL